MQWWELVAICLLLFFAGVGLIVVMFILAAKELDGGWSDKPPADSVPIYKSVGTVKVGRMKWKAPTKEN